MAWSQQDLLRARQAVWSFLPPLWAVWEIGRPQITSRGNNATATVTGTRIADGLERTVELPLPDTITNATARQWVLDLIAALGT